MPIPRRDRGKEPDSFVEWAKGYTGIVEYCDREGEAPVCLAFVVKGHYIVGDSGGNDRIFWSEVCKHYKDTEHEEEALSHLLGAK